METVFQDVMFGLRMFRKNPGFTAVAVMALALGIGANATVFSIANAFLYQALPFADSDRVLYISSVSQTTGRGRGESLPDFRDIQAHAKSFDTMGAFSRFDVDVSDRSGLPTQYKGARVTANTFPTIGQQAIAGRGFLPEDERPGAAPVVLLGYRIWQDRYGADRSIIGKTIRVNEVPTEVIGVMPPSIHFPGDSKLWIPLVPDSKWERRENRGLTLFGRLAAGSTLQSARAELEALAKDLERQYPATNKDIGALVQTYNDYFTNSDTRLVFLALLGAVGFVLLIACANVANLMLARAVGRAREISVRSALGAGRWRLIQQMLVESVLLSAAGGLFGSVAGIWGVRLFQDTLIPEDTPSYLTFNVDYRVIFYLVSITIGTGILFGLVPALRLAKLDINAVLKDGGQGAGTGWRARRLSTLLVVGEMALAFVLLAGAGLMIRSFLKMALTPIGARTDHLMSMDILLRAKRYPTDASRIVFYQQLTKRLETLPGVAMVAMASNLPGDGWSDFTYEPEGAAPADPRTWPKTGAVVVSPNYFPILEVHPRRGRLFSESDGAAAVPVAIVNETFARICWRGEDPLGKRLRLAPRASGSAPQPLLTVVGVIPDIVQSDTSQGSHDPLIYLPYRQSPEREMVIAARTLLPPEGLGKAFRREVQALDGDLPVTDLRTLDEMLWDRTRTWRVYGSMFAIFAAMALLLASVGLYAVTAHGISQRTREIGVRMALGASKNDILAMVAREGATQIGFGIAIGLAGAFGLTRILDSILVEVKPADPATLVMAVLVLTVAAVAGSIIPARRAVRVDPLAALRHD